MPQRHDLSLDSSTVDPAVTKKCWLSSSQVLLAEAEKVNRLQEAQARQVATPVWTKATSRRNPHQMVTLNARYVTLSGCIGAAT